MDDLKAAPEGAPLQDVSMELGDLDGGQVGFAVATAAPIG